MKKSIISAFLCCLLLVFCCGCSDSDIKNNGEIDLSSQSNDIGIQLAESTIKTPQVDQDISISEYKVKIFSYKLPNGRITDNTIQNEINKWIKETNCEVIDISVGTYCESRQYGTGECFYTATILYKDK